MTAFKDGLNSILWKENVEATLNIKVVIESLCQGSSKGNIVAILMVFEKSCWKYDSEHMWYFAYDDS